MRIQSIPVGEFQVNCYLLSNDEGDALIIDPGADAETIQDVLAEHGLRVRAYLITHGHMDHISALADLHDHAPAPVAMHPDDLAWAFSPDNHMRPFYEPPSRPKEIVRMLNDGQEWTDAGMKYRIIATPGHSPGSVCYYFPEEAILFSGDTLFAGSVGRTDLRGGNERRLKESLARLTNLPDATRVYPGHGPATTIGREKRSNPFL